MVGGEKEENGEERRVLGRGSVVGGVRCPSFLLHDNLIQLQYVYIADENSENDAVKYADYADLFEKAFNQAIVWLEKKKDTKVSFDL